MPPLGPPLTISTNLASSVTTFRLLHSDPLGRVSQIPGEPISPLLQPDSLASELRPQIRGKIRCSGQRDWDRQLCGKSINFLPKRSGIGLSYLQLSGWLVVGLDSVVDLWVAMPFTEDSRGSLLVQADFKILMIQWHLWISGHLSRLNIYITSSCVCVCVGGDIPSLFFSPHWMYFVLSSSGSTIH